MLSFTQPSHTALRLGAIHKKPSVPNRMYVEWTRSSSMWEKAIGLGLSTLHGYDHYELICAEPDPLSGGTRLAKYQSLCQPWVERTVPFKRGTAFFLMPLMFTGGRAFQRPRPLV